MDLSSDAKPLFWSMPAQADYIRRVLALPTTHFTSQQHVARRLLWIIHEEFETMTAGDGVPDDYLNRAESVIDACEPFFRKELAALAHRQRPTRVAPPIVRPIR